MIKMARVLLWQFDLMLYSVVQQFPLHTEPRMTPEKFQTAAGRQSSATRSLAVASRVAEVPPELKYLSFLSHDLNNNLNAIALHLHLLRKRLITAPQFSAELSVIDLLQNTISHTTDGMQRLLIHQRLRTERPQPQIHPVSLCKLAARVAAHYSGQAASKGLEFEIELPPSAVIHSDGDLIFIILQNLVGNAVKYSDRGMVRLVAGRSGTQNEDIWSFSVIDEGCGIPPSHLVSIFREFQRGASSPQREGVGLGLAIASQAARLLGADLSVVSHVGMGSTFCLRVADMVPAEIARQAREAR
jgi:signal transduction histidine kinase